MQCDAQELSKWIGRTETQHDQIGVAPVAALSATLNLEPDQLASGDALPPLWHWLYFLPLSKLSEAGEDGHPQRGGFLPPVPLPRRMWAGGRLEFKQAIRIGEFARRISRIADVKVKDGQSGPLAFVTVEHAIHHVDGVAILEEHDIVYRNAPAPDAPPPKRVAPPDNAQWRRTITPDPVLLFRYSALTFNSHLIHYSREYVTGVEGYPGLVVHGPLIATLLMDLLRREMPSAQVQKFSFRAVSPLFDIDTFDVCGKREADGKTVTLWAENHLGGLAMQAQAELA